MKSFTIGETIVGLSRTFIIAEIGQNHQGSLEIAKTMISKAKESGADCVKFQKSCLSEKFTTAALDCLYESEHSWGKTYGEHKEFLEFTIDEYRQLQSFANEVGIMFTASAMDLTSLQQLYQLNVPFIKIGSGDANNFPLLTYASGRSVPLVISTGMQSEQTIRQIVEIMQEFNKTNFCLMHCVSAYPTPPENCGLRFIKKYEEWFPNICVGYSGHEVGIAISVAATLCGAKIIERHFTLDKNQKGNDHKLSLDPEEFANMVQAIRVIDGDDTDHHKQDHDFVKNILNRIDAMNFKSEDVEKALMTVNTKYLLDCERPCFAKLGKSLVFNNDLEMGHEIGSNDLNVKVCHPKGLPGEEFYNILGKFLKKSITKDFPVTNDCFE